MVLDTQNKISPSRNKNLDEESDEDKSEEEIEIKRSPIISMRLRSPIRKSIEEQKKSTTSSPEAKKKIKVDLNNFNFETRKSPKKILNSKDIARRIVDNPDPDYDSLTDEIRDICYEEFKYKYRNLNSKYENLNLDYDEGEDLYRLHENYHNKIRDIYAANNSNMYEIFYVIFLCIIEYIFVYVLKITSLEGYAKYEWKKINKIRVLIIEYLQEEYSYGTSDESVSENVFWRFGKTYLFSFVLFIFTHTAIKYMGFNDSIKEDLSNILEKKFLSSVTKSSIEAGNTGEKEGEGNNVTNILISQLLEKVGNMGSKAPAFKMSL